jgi:hypothetical protein
MDDSTSISQMKALIVKMFSAPTGFSHMLGPLYTPASSTLPKADSEPFNDEDFFCSIG